MLDATRHWRLNPLCRLRWRHWDSEYILFNEGSGQTHFLNELGAATLQRLQQVASVSHMDLVAWLSAEYVLPADEQLQAHIAVLLTDLDELGLIEPCSP